MEASWAVLVTPRSGQAISIVAESLLGSLPPGSSLGDSIEAELEIVVPHSSGSVARKRVTERVSPAERSPKSQKRLMSSREQAPASGPESDQMPAGGPSSRETPVAVPGPKLVTTRSKAASAPAAMEASWAVLVTPRSGRHVPNAVRAKSLSDASASAAPRVSASS